MGSSGAGFFDLNQPYDSDSSDFAEHTQSNGDCAEEDGSIDEDVSSQPVVPFVGMTFDDIEEAQKVYNKYAFKMGFGSRKGSSKNSLKKGCEHILINRVFECVHARMPATSGTNPGGTSTVQGGTATEMSNGSTNTSRQAGVAMQMSDKRQRNRVSRHNCKARMIVSLKQGVYTVTTFNEQHTHAMVEQQGCRRYYQSHRKIPKEDLEFLELLHNRNLRTSDIMGLLGDAHGGDPRNLGYVKRDVTNQRSKMRSELLLRDLDITIEYFKEEVGRKSQLFLCNSS